MVDKLSSSMAVDRFSDKLLIWMIEDEFIIVEFHQNLFSKSYVQYKIFYETHLNQSQIS